MATAASLVTGSGDSHQTRELTPAQIDIIKSTVPVLAEHGNTITTTFYQTIIKENPDLNSIFNKANQSNGAQPRALAASIHAYAANIDNLPALAAAVELIVNKHASLHVQPAHYAVVWAYLSRAMAEVLGAALTPDVAAAWEVAYWQLADLLIATERKLYGEARGWTDWQPFRIARKVRESDAITSFYLEPADGGAKPLPSYKPGQYISIRTEVPALGGMKQPRQYSLSDAPNGEYYRISIKRESGAVPGHPGYVSNTMHAERDKGDVIEVSHPRGEFFLDLNKDAESPVVLLSAGVGITAVTSMFNALLKQDSARPITFGHGSRTSSLRAFTKDLEDAAAKHENVRLVLFTKNVDDSDREGVGYHQIGRLVVSKLAKEADLHVNNPKTQYFLCGPDQFMAQVGEDLQAMGVDEGRILAERFAPTLGSG